MKPESGAIYWILCFQAEEDDGPPAQPVQATARVVAARQDLPEYVPVVTDGGVRWDLVTSIDDGRHPEHVVWTATDTGQTLSCWRSFPSKSEAFDAWRGLVLEYIEQAEANADRARAMLAESQA